MRTVRSSSRLLSGGSSTHTPLEQAPPRAYPTRPGAGTPPEQAPTPRPDPPGAGTPLGADPPGADPPQRPAARHAGIALPPWTESETGVKT